jgi:hypothetical protein
LVASAKARNIRCVGVDEPGERGRLHRLGNGKRKPGAIDKMMAETAEDHRPHAARMSFGKKGGDPRAHRIAHHIGRLYAEIIEKRASVFRHLLHGVGGGVMEFFAAAMPPVVEGDDAPPRLGQGLYPLRENPIYRMGRGEPMNEKDGLAAIARRRPLVDKRQADPMVQHF